MEAPRKASVDSSVAYGSRDADVVHGEPAAGAVGPQRGVLNPHLALLDEDHLYHFGLHSHQPLKELFGDVRVVCIGGSANRMRSFANSVVDVLGIRLPCGQGLADISTTDRYCLYKAGPVLSVNHGMGTPSVSIMLHEIAKLLHYAGADAAFIRLGTSGGVGVAPGTVVVSDQVFSGLLEPEYKIAVLGKVVARPTLLSASLNKSLIAAAPPGIKVIEGHTMSCDDFYEGQARLDGAICEYSAEDKMEFLQRARDVGICNIEMEALAFSAFCHKLNLRCAVCCSVILNRLVDDQITKDHAKLQEYGTNAMRVVLAFLKRELAAAPS